MAFYSPNNIKTEIIDPVYFSQDRAEFRLDRGTLMNNIKIGNLGLFAGGAHRYNEDGGVLSIIKAIHLYDGRITLQSQHHANERYAFNNSLSNNDHNGNVERFTHRHSQGYTIEPVRDVVGKALNILNNGAGGSMVSVPPADAITNTKKGYIQVRELLPIMKVLPCLPSKVFTQLRLVIEFEDDVSKMLTGTANPATIIKPVLIVDRVVNDTQEAKLISKLSNALFNDYEYTQIDMPVNAAGTQQVHKKTAAFNNKFLKRLRVKVNYADKTNYVAANAVKGRGSLGNSWNMNNRKIQYRVNGSNVLPRASITGDNRRLALFCDTYGNVNMTQEMCSGLPSAAQNGTVVLDDNIGTKDMDGISINKVIEELQIEMDRDFITDATANSRYNSAMKLVLEGEVQRQINFGNGGYNVGYAT